ncbi:Sec23/Sec24 trunk domain containing protein [Tritrichomonas foetus]|uniref:Sec23/Sec24 trunk domain containing protein n=1 Tax=Tritrichomonas foetus TaxID=1144522 RepID=A0A1J4KDH2_9EUKA|nr:Sec23/Sec24 trunk domain containing protein [Tritrichomonas foetus]|eukprot:OHT09481.1 Sec23/Sec24 trunk domain containing protein [Tritrichomonas foetus]
MKSNSRRYVIPQMQDMSQPPLQGAPPPQPPQDFNLSQIPQNYQSTPTMAPAPQPQLSGQAYSQNLPPRNEIQFPWANPKLLNPDVPPGCTQFPTYLRSVTSIYPSSKEVADQCKIPFGLVISPAFVQNCPVIDCKDSTVPRCSNCSAYLCPQVQVINNVEWKCPICNRLNKINGNDQNAQNSFSYGVQPSFNFNSENNLNNRMELKCPVYDIIAPMPAYANIDGGPCFLFIFDLSPLAYQLGFTQQFLATVKASIDAIPTNARVGIMTMSHNITVFDLMNAGEFVISDLFDPAIPASQQSVFPRLESCKENFVSAIDNLIERVPSPSTLGHCFGSVLVAIEKLMHNIGGIAVVGYIGLPRHGPYPLNKRDTNDENELNLLRLPNDGSGKVFRDYAFKLNRASVSVHIFTAGPEFVDLSTTAVPAGLTCGECHYYRNFDGLARQKMHADIYRTLTNSYCWDACLRLRATPGIKLVRPHTNCTLRNNELISFPVIASEDAIAFELSIENPSSSSSNSASTNMSLQVNNCIFQLAFVYTNNDGIRMIRVFTVETPRSKDIREVCRSIDEATLTTMMTRRAGTALLSVGPIPGLEQTRKEINAMLMQGSNSVNIASFSSMYHLMHSLVSNPTFRARHAEGVDGRMSSVIRLRAISVTDLLLYLYPRMFSVDSGEVLPLTGESFGKGTVFLFHTVDRIFIWVGGGASQEFINGAFGVSDIASLPSELPQLQTPENAKVMAIVQSCWELSSRYLPVEVIGQGGAREYVFADILVDDSTVSGTNLKQFLQALSLNM